MDILTDKIDAIKPIGTFDLCKVREVMTSNKICCPESKKDIYFCDSNRDPWLITISNRKNRCLLGDAENPSGK